MIFTKIALFETLSVSILQFGGYGEEAESEIKDEFEEDGNREVEVSIYLSWDTVK